MIEVEIKLKIDSREKIIEKLESQGFKRGDTVIETDMYFNGNDHDFRKTDEALRIRKTVSLDGNILIPDTDSTELITLTYKGPKLDDISMSRKELWVNVEDFDAMKTILKSLHFRPVRPVIKKRTYYHGEEMVACVDSVEGLGDFIELEIMVDDEQGREKALSIIELELNSLGFKMADTTTTSYLSMLQKISD